MVADSASSLQVLTDRLYRLHRLSDDDRDALEDLPLRTALIPLSGNIVGVGEPASRCAIILDGMAASYKLTGNGRRQIVCFHLAGDLPDLQSLYFGTVETGIVAVSPCRIGYLPSDKMLDLCSRRPSLALVLWRESLLQGALVREWLLNVGQRDARVRLAHLLCEVVERHRDAGLTSDYSCPFPLTQTGLADVLGLSTVHVNRTVQELRGEGLIAWQRARLTVTDWDRLCLVGDFNPAYLRTNGLSFAP